MRKKNTDTKYTDGFNNYIYIYIYILFAFILRIVRRPCKVKGATTQGCIWNVEANKEKQGLQLCNQNF